MYHYVFGGICLRAIRVTKNRIGVYRESKNRRNLLHDNKRFCVRNSISFLSEAIHVESKFLFYYGEVNGILSNKDHN